MRQFEAFIARSLTLDWSLLRLNNQKLIQIAMPRVTEKVFGPFFPENGDGGDDGSDGDEDDDYNDIENGDDDDDDDDGWMLNRMCA